MDLNLHGGVVQLHKAAAIEEGRYSMNQIDVRQVNTPDGPKMRCVATDGRCLAVVDLAYEFGIDMPGRISLEAWETASKLKANKKGCLGPKMTANGKVALAGKNGENIEYERPADDPAAFPRYESVIPVLGAGKIRLQLNPLLLLATAEAIGMSAKQSGIEIAFNDPDKETPTLVRMAQQASDELDELMKWQRPEAATMAPLPELLEGEETQEQHAERERAHIESEQARVDAWNAHVDEMARQQLREIADCTQRLQRAVRSLREFPERPTLTEPMLVLRPGVPEARGVLMPLTIDA